MKAGEANCRVCGSAETRLLCETQNGHSRTSPLRHHRCLACGSVFVAEAITHEELAEAYGGVNAERYYREIETETRAKLEHSRLDLERRGLKDARVIDLGTGNGLFIRVLHQAGFTQLAAHEIPGSDLAGIEPLATLYRDIDHASIPDAAFDVVTLLDVAEHVPNPRALLATCARVLRPGGHAYIHTPVVTRLDRVMHVLDRLPLLRHIGQAWQKARTSIFHLQNFTPRSLRAAAKTARLECVDLRVRNELSWPLARYVRVYMHLPAVLARPFSWLLYPMLKTCWWNGNKAIAWFRKPE